MKAIRKLSGVVDATPPASYTSWMASTCACTAASSLAAFPVKVTIRLVLDLVPDLLALLACASVREVRYAQTTPLWQGLGLDL